MHVPLYSSLAVGLAIGLLSRWLLRSPGEPFDAPSNHYERQRLAKLRSQNGVYRRLEGLIEKLAGALDESLDLDHHPLQRSLRQSSDYRHWTARTFLVTKTIEGMLCATVIFGLVGLIGGRTMATLFSVALLVAYPLLSYQSIIAAAKNRLQRQRVRFPFVVDQVALMMQAGGNFEESLQTIAKEEPNHPLTEELNLVISDITAGRTRRDALLDLRSRIPDRDIGELLFAIVKGEELGTPISQILSDQADQMRIKRAQWGEKSAAEAEVQIVFPGMLVMVACLIVVLGPILLPAVIGVFGP